MQTRNLARCSSGGSRVPAKVTRRSLWNGRCYRASRAASTKREGGMWRGEAGGKREESARKSGRNSGGTRGMASTTTEPRSAGNSDSLRCHAIFLHGCQLALTDSVSAGPWDIQFPHPPRRARYMLPGLSLCLASDSDYAAGADQVPETGLRA